MNVLHYSFSLSACPKCHLLICKHTSLADLDFNTDQQRKQCSTTTNSTRNSSQQHLSDGTNVYIFPATVSDNRYSWTTFGTDFNESFSTLHKPLSDNEITGDNIPFADENIINSSLLLTPTIEQIVRTQSDRVNPLPPPIDLSLKKGSISTIAHQSSSFPLLKYVDLPLIKPRLYPTTSCAVILLLIFLFLITSTIDLVLIYIYYHLHYICLLGFLSSIVLCDMVLWINNLIQSPTIPSYLLLIPFSIRFYLLYELLESLLIILDRDENRQVLQSLCKMKKPKLYQNLTLFHLTHTGFFLFINLYFCSNNFQFSTELVLSMDYFIPQWLSNDHLSYSTSTMDTITSLSSSDRQISDAIPASSIFVLISILYYLIINYSLLSTFLIFKRFSFLLILSRLCLIIPRIYTLIFLFHLNAWWLSITFLLVHLILMITLLVDRSKLQPQQKTVFLQIIFSFITHQSVDDIAISALISLENISIFLHRLYLETFFLSRTQIALRLIAFIAVLISLQIIGFLMSILSKHLLYRTKAISK